LLVRSHLEALNNALDLKAREEATDARQAQFEQAINEALKPHGASLVRQGKGSYYIKGQRGHHTATVWVTLLDTLAKELGVEVPDALNADLFERKQP
jgi:hypothetical protein